MQNPCLNLARTWRPRRFDELVGQDLVVRLLQNSLYRSYFFPVYLFAGQRGCGKTTSARIFATAINCRVYEQFIKDPQKVSLPCLTCDGCQMMAHGKHPDVIEIDAASHTGVDHVRQVIDAASFVPVYGQKRIYIIDEAHMLSKAAFNALLKMLEEPPLSVLFMLATTDAHKIPDTIKSRCFHLFFSPLDPSVITEYVSRICAAESIPFDDAGLRLIAHQAEGSARDAVNMVERVRLAHDGVTIDAVRQVLGCLDDASCVRLFETLFTGDPQQVLGLFIELDIEKFTPRVLLARLIEYLHGVMWVLHGVDASASRTTGRFTQTLRPRGTRALVLEMLSVCYAYEAVLARTSNAHQVFQMVCLTLCQIAGGDVISHSLDSGPNTNSSVVKPKKADADVSGARAFLEHGKGQEARKSGASTDVIEDKQSMSRESGLSEEGAQSATTSRSGTGEPSDERVVWQQLIEQVEKLNDPLVYSIFKQAARHEHNGNEKRLHLHFPRQLSFFADWLENTQSQWQPLVERCFGANITVELHFDEGEMQQPEVNRALAVPPVQVMNQTGIVPTSQRNFSGVEEQSAAAQSPKGHGNAHESGRSTRGVVSRGEQVGYSQYQPGEARRSSEGAKTGGSRLNLKDKESWPKTHELLSVFPGVVSINYQQEES